MSTSPVASPLRVTFDSNAWQMSVLPSLASNDYRFADFVIIHDALQGRQILGFICETVGTLEAIRNDGRKAYFTSIRPTVNVQFVNGAPGQALLKIDVASAHDQHPGLPRVLEERLQLAIGLGMRVMRAPRMVVPIPALMLDLSVFADETDVPTAAIRDNRWGEVVETIEQRCVGSALLRSLRETVGGRAEAIKETDFASAVAEWADGDSVAAHVAYNNDLFCTEDQGKSAGRRSIFDPSNRQWLTVTYGVQFVTVRELAERLRTIRLAQGPLSLP